MVKYGRKNASLNSFCNDVVITDLGAYFTADPEKADEAAKIARSIIEAFARKGPTDEEMKTVRKQFQNIIEQSQKTPRYWAGVLSDLDYHKTQLSDVKEALEKYTTYTKEDILNALKKYIVEDRRFQVIALPKKSGIRVVSFRQKQFIDTFVKALRTDTFLQFGSRLLHDILVNLFPIVSVISNLFTIRTERQQALKIVNSIARLFKFFNAVEKFILAVEKFILKINGPFSTLTRACNSFISIGFLM